MCCNKSICRPTFDQHIYRGELQFEKLCWCRHGETCGVATNDAKQKCSEMQTFDPKKCFKTCVGCKICVFVSFWQQLTYAFQTFAQDTLRRYSVVQFRIYFSIFTPTGDDRSHETFWDWRYCFLCRLVTTHAPHTHTHMTQQVILWERCSLHNLSCDTLFCSLRFLTVESSFSLAFFRVSLIFCAMVKYCKLVPHTVLHTHSFVL